MPTINEILSASIDDIADEIMNTNQGSIRPEINAAAICRLFKHIIIMNSRIKALEEKVANRGEFTHDKN